MKEIPLTFGKVALVDDDLYEWLISFPPWQAHDNHGNGWYAQTKVWMAETKRQRGIKMHRLVAGVNNPNILVDHRDHNGLNNQRENLRVCTRGQNNGNRLKFPGTSSRFKGVSRYKDSKWQAGITEKGKRKHLGHFELEEEAARAYDEAALRIYGEFALTNHQLGLI